jgi:hypothetical protein
MAESTCTQISHHRALSLSQALEFPFSLFGPSRDYGVDLSLEVYLWAIYPYFITFRVTKMLMPPPYKLKNFIFTFLCFLQRPTRRNFGWFRTFIIPRPYYGTTFGNLQWRGIKIISLTNIRPIIIFFHSSQCRLIPYLHQRPIFFKENSIHSSIVAILELIRGAQCLIEVIRSSGEEMWSVDAYQIPYYSRSIEGEKRTHPRFADWQRPLQMEIYAYLPKQKRNTKSSSNPFKVKISFEAYL